MLVSIRYFPGRPLNRDGGDVGIAVVTDDYLPFAASLFGVELDLSRALITVTARDCWNWFASGIEITATTADEKTEYAYFRGSSVSRDGGTDTSGVAWVINLPPGNTELVATRDGAEVSRLTINAAPGGNQAEMYPSTR